MTQHFPQKSPVFDPRQWLDDCERALADADYLATRLARVAAYPDSDLTALRLRITALRADFERARHELGYGDLEPGAGRPLDGASPWCAPVRSADD